MGLYSPMFATHCSATYWKYPEYRILQCQFHCHISVFSPRTCTVMATSSCILTVYVSFTVTYLSSLPGCVPSRPPVPVYSLFMSVSLSRICLLSQDVYRHAHQFLYTHCLCQFHCHVCPFSPRTCTVTPTSSCILTFYVPFNVMSLPSPLGCVLSGPPVPVYSLFRPVSLSRLCLLLQDVYRHAHQFAGCLLHLTHEFPEPWEVFSGAVWTAFYMVSLHGGEWN